jgi:hypothetical protein
LKPFRNTIAILIAAVLLAGLVPAASAADANDNLPVLTSLGHQDTDTVAVTSVSAPITLTVPDRYIGEYPDHNSIDLSSNLTFGSSPLYRNVVLSVNVTHSAPAVIDGDPVTLTVTYNLAAEADGEPKHTTIYTLEVVRDDAVGPTFSGAITKPVRKSNSLVFSSEDFSKLYAQNDGLAIGYISIHGANPAFGYISYNGGPYVSGTPVRIEDANLFTFSAESTGTIRYDVFAYTVSDTSHSNPLGTVVLTINSYDIPDITVSINETIPKGTILPMTADYFIAHCDLHSSNLVSVEITPINNIPGKWSLKSATGAAVPFTGRKTITAAALSGLTFTAMAPGTATFNWRIANEAGLSTLKTGSITVASPTLTLTPFQSEPELRGGTYTLGSAAFEYTPLTASMTYIKLTSVPPIADGYLFLGAAVPASTDYGYPQLAANTALTTGAVIPVDYLDYLGIVTKTTGTRDEITFKWTATADLKVTTATWAEPVAFTLALIKGGTLAPYVADMNIPFAFPTSDVLGEFSRLTGRQLSYITFTLPDRNAGALYLNYDPISKKGTAVAATTKYYSNKTPNLSSLTYAPVTDWFGTAAVKFNAYAEDGSYITSSITIVVQNAQGGTISLQMDKNSTLPLDAGTFQASFLAATGKALSSVSFTLPSATLGRLYYDYISEGNPGTLMASGGSYSVFTSPYLSHVTFVPATDVTGNVIISFTGYPSGSSIGIPCRLIITVVNSPGGIVSYSLTENSSVTLSGSQFSDEFVRVTGSVLSYINITPPPTASGKLYYQYDADTMKGTAVASATKYFDGRNPDISDITFVPAKDFIGTVVVPYKGYNSAGTAFAGKLKFIVNESSQVVSYATMSGDPVMMNAGDFQSAFYLLSGGAELSYVKFALPSTSYGKLYYGFNTRTEYDSLVTADKKYAVDAEPYLSVVTFLPTDTYSGSFILSYTGYSTSGAAFSGKIRITVAPNDTGTVNYYTNALTPVTFKSSDFTAVHTGGTGFSYVRFTLPSDSYGHLYYNYSASSVYRTDIAASSYYDLSALSLITFVPNTSFSGSLAIGYSTYDSTYTYRSSGTVVIDVKSSDVDPVGYAASIGSTVSLNADDFNTVFLNRSGSTLKYVIFSALPTTLGQLVLGYKSPGVFTKAVQVGERYYRSYAPLLSDITFVPNTGYTGTVTIAYTGYTAEETPYTGKIVITVSASNPFPDVKTGYEWASPAISYLYGKGVVKGRDDGKFHPADYVTRGDFVLMLTRAFNMTSYSADNFSDVPLGIYYYSAIATAKYYGVVTGEDGKFHPSAYITRQDAMTILAATLDVKGIPILPGSADDLSDFPDASDISDYAVDAMASLVKAGIITGSDGYLNPKDNITRAEMSVMFYKVLMM